MKNHVAWKRAFTLALSLLLTIGALPLRVAQAAGEKGLARITQYSANTVFTKAGDTGYFTFTVEFPTLNDTPVAYPNMSVDQLRGLEVSMGAGSAFVFSGGVQTVKPFSNAMAGQNRADFGASLVYKGSGDTLEIVLSHASSIESTDELGNPISTPVMLQNPQSIYVKETIRYPEPTPTPTPPGPDPAESPRVNISGSLPLLTAGRIGEIDLRLTNNSLYDAWDVSLTLVDSSPKLFIPTTLTGGVAKVGDLYRGYARDAVFPIDVLPDVETGYYTVQVAIKMYNLAGMPIDQTEYIQVYISNPSQEEAGMKPPSLSVSSSALDKSTPGEDGVLNLMVGITNTGERPATDIRVTLSGLGDGLTLNETLPTKSAGTLDAGRTTYVSYALKGSSTLESGIHELTATIKYKQPDGTEISTSETLFLNIILPPKPVSNEKIQLSSMSQNTSNPGETNTITVAVSFKNTGTTAAENAALSLDGLSPSGFTLLSDFGDKGLGTIAPDKTVSQSFRLHVAADLPDGNYPIKTIVAYKNASGEEKTIETTIFIFIKHVTQVQAKDVRLVSMNQDVSDPGAANTVTVSMSFTNFGTASAENAVLSFADLSASTFTLLGSFGDKRLGTIAPGKTVSLNVRLYVAAELLNGNYPIKTALTYKDKSGVETTVETTIYVYVKRPEKPGEGSTPPDTSVPRVIISQHSTSEQTVTAGSPFEVRFTLTNTSSAKDIKNMKVTVSDELGIFLPVEGVNSFYVEALGRGGSVELAISLTPKQDAESKSYPVMISLAYEDKDNAPYSVSESLSIPVYQPQRLEVSNLVFQGDGMGSAYLNFQFINKGKSTLYNMTVKVEGPMSLMEGEYFVGNFAPGSMDLFEDNIVPESFGDVTGFLVIQYEDAVGNPMEYRQELTAFIDQGFTPGEVFPGGEIPAGEFPGGEFPGEISPEEEGGGRILGLSVWLFWTLAGGIVLAAGVVVTIVLVRKKRRKAALLEDDE